MAQIHSNPIHSYQYATRFFYSKLHNNIFSKYLWRTFWGCAPALLTKLDLIDWLIAENLHKPSHEHGFLTLSHVRSPTSWLCVNSRYAVHFSRCGGSSTKGVLSSLLEFSSGPSGEDNLDSCRECFETCLLVKKSLFLIKFYNFFSWGSNWGKVNDGSSFT